MLKVFLSGTGLLAPSNVKGTHTISACYLYFAPDENSGYLSDFRK